MLDRAIELRHADKGTLQIYDHRADHLLIVSHRGFSNEFLTHFKHVKRFDSSSCGRAAGTGIVVNINDVTKDVAFRSHADTALEDEIKAVQSIPLHYAGMLVGVLSVHYKETRERMSRNLLTSPIASEIATALLKVIELQERQSFN